MRIVTIESCPVCGSLDIEKAFDATDHFSTKEVFPIYECIDCGFRFTNKFPSEEVIDKYYDSPDYISHSDSDKGLINRLYHFFRKHMLKKKINLVSDSISNEAKTIKLLDYGCGTGYFLNEAKGRGYNVSGIEKDKKAREYANSVFDLKVMDEPALWSIEKSTYQVITMWHVLEHVEKLNETLAKINDLLTPDGLFVLALPNHHSYDAIKYKDLWAAYDIPRHLWHFSPNTVEKLLNKHNFKIINRKTMPLDAFYISLLSEKYKGSNSKPIQYLKAFIIGFTGYLRSIYNVEESSSLIYIARKL